MPVIMFIIDNSASMNQRTFYGTTLLDVARGAVDQFTKMRERDIHSRWDRRMLLTLEEPPHHIKAGWKESVSIFNTELRNMKATGMTTIGTALGRAFDLLNLNRAQTGLDCFGQGRYPTSNESAIIICITDGQKLTSEDGSANEIVIPGPQVPLSDLYLEPFRWDQRLYSLVLRMPATDDRSRDLTNGNQFVEKASDSPINAMCEVTGGRSYKIENLRQLNQCLESICQKCQSGAVLNFQIQPDQKLDTAWQNSLKMVYLKQHNQRGFNNEHWPLPEPYWPTANAYSLPPRQAHPIVRFNILKTDVQIPDRFPFDKFELEASPLTQYILEMRDSNCAWECSVPGSGFPGNPNEAAPPFGFLKASSNFQSVNLFVLPFNYPVLFRLIDELRRTRLPPVEDFLDRFKAYMERVPAYYYHRLSYVLEQQGFPRQFLNSYREIGNNNGLLSLHVKTVLSRSKANAKAEFDKMIRDVTNKGPNDDKIQVKLHHPNRVCEQTNDALEVRTFSCDHPSKRGDVNRFDKVPRPYENPYDIQRCDLRCFLPKMRHNLQKLMLNESRPMDGEWLHEQPMMQMGNFHDYIQKNQALRPIEEGPQRQHSFGNPFKVRNAIVIDEADSDFPNAGSALPGPRRARSPSVCSESSNSSSGSNASRISLPLSPDFSYKAWRASSRPSSPAVHRSGSFDDDHMNGLEPLNVSGASNGFDLGSPGSPTDSYSSPDFKKVVSNGSATQAIASVLKRFRSLVKMIRTPQIDGKRVHRKLIELDCDPKLQKDILNYLIAEAHRFQRHTLINLLSKRMNYIRPRSEEHSPSPTSEETEPVLFVNNKHQPPQEPVSGLGADLLAYLPQSHDAFETQRHKLKTRTNGASESQNGVYHPPMKIMRLDMAPAGVIR